MRREEFPSLSEFVQRVRLAFGLAAGVNIEVICVVHFGTFRFPSMLHGFVICNGWLAHQFDLAMLPPAHS